MHIANKSPLMSRLPLDSNSVEINGQATLQSDTFGHLGMHRDKGSVAKVGVAIVRDRAAGRESALGKWTEFRIKA